MKARAKNNAVIVFVRGRIATTVKPREALSVACELVFAAARATFPSLNAVLPAMDDQVQEPLTRKQITQIRADHERGKLSQREIADKHGTSQSTVCRILKREEGT